MFGDFFQNFNSSLKYTPINGLVGNIRTPFGLSVGHRAYNIPFDKSNFLHQSYFMKYFLKYEFRKMEYLIYIHIVSDFFNASCNHAYITLKYFLQII